MRDLILVTGSEGLIGSRYIEISGLKRLLHAPRQIEFDITDKSQVAAIVASYRFKAVVHFAAFTDVDKAEEERGERNSVCWQVNVEGTRNLVEAVAPFKTEIQFIQISTNMVFPGTKDDPGPYLENHPLDHDLSQLTWYGYSKAEAEKVVKEVLGEQATILRLAYPVRARFEGKLDYLRKLLKLYDEGRLYPLFSDQQISITFIDEACRVIDKIISEGHRGVFHAASRDTTTPYQFFSYILEKVRGVRNGVETISVDEFLQKTNKALYRYPKYAALSSAITEHKLGVKFSSWREIGDKLIAQGLGQ